MTHKLPAQPALVLLWPAGILVSLISSWWWSTWIMINDFYITQGATQMLNQHWRVKTTGRWILEIYIALARVRHHLTIWERAVSWCLRLRLVKSWSISFSLSFLIPQDEAIAEIRALQILLAVSSGILTKTSAPSKSSIDDINKRWLFLFVIVIDIIIIIAIAIVKFLILINHQVLCWSQSGDAIPDRLGCWEDWMKKRTTWCNSDILEILTIVFWNWTLKNG